MSEPKIVATALGVLRSVMATALCAGMLAIAFSGAGVCQAPGYGQTVDDWTPYESGQHLERLQKIAGPINSRARLPIIVSN
jgi:hypothetical protein